jgi:hypothetical protein
MRRHALAPSLAAALALASSCNFFFPFAPDQVCETEIRAICHFVHACCNASERVVFGGLANFRSEGDCVNELLAEQGSCGNALAVHEATQQGRFEYDGALAERCQKPRVDALNSCNADAVLGEALEEDPACAGLGSGNFAFGTGKVAEDGRCFNAFECAEPGSVCDPLEDVEGDGQILITRVGTCRSPAKEGQDCSADGSDGLCEPGTFCDFQTEECTAIDLLNNGEACFADGQCESGFCNDVQVNVQPSCDDRLDDGADCLDDNDCDSRICDPNDRVCLAPEAIVVEACNGLQGDDTQF